MQLTAVAPKRYLRYQQRRESIERSTAESYTSDIGRKEAIQRLTAQSLNSEIGGPERQGTDRPRKATGSSERARKTTAAIVQLA
jgi:hypothetical protein